MVLVTHRTTNPADAVHVTSERANRSRLTVTSRLAPPTIERRRRNGRDPWWRNMENSPEPVAPPGCGGPVRRAGRHAPTRRGQRRDTVHGVDPDGDRADRID